MSRATIAAACERRQRAATLAHYQKQARLAAVPDYFEHNATHAYHQALYRKTRALMRDARFSLGGVDPRDDPRGFML